MANTPINADDDPDTPPLDQVTTPHDHPGGRLDKVLADLAPALSRTRYKDLIQSDQVWVNDVA
jgi:23S rRNA-/tRNA-specific pseudouridylate synthase